VRLLGRLGLTVFTAASALGCNDLEVCGSRREPVLASDGRGYRCTTAEDCPRTAGVSVCVIDVSSEQTCVTCAETVCTQVIPEKCG
jgi:hypothetical protein